MITLKLKTLLDEFEEWVIKGRATKIPYQEWRFLKQHAEDQVRIERDGWGDLRIFSETCCKILIEGWQYDDDSLGTYLDYIYMQEFDNEYSKWYDKYKDTGYCSKWRGEPVGVDTDVSSVEVRKNINGKNVIEIKNTNEVPGFSTNRKDKDNMNLFKNVEFGSCENDNVKMSIYGIAVKNASGTWVSYDTKSGNVMDVDILNFSAKYLYKMPVATKDIAVGDTIVHCRKPMFVTRKEYDKLLVIDPAAAEEKIILPVKSPFGFDVYTKVVNLFGNFAAGASENSPFGNMLPLMLLADDNKSDDILPLMFMMGGGKLDMSNPMMLYFLMGDKGNKDNLLPLLFLNQSFPAAANKECKCCGEGASCEDKVNH